MPLLKAEDVESKYVNITGCVQNFYPIADNNDLQLFCMVEKKADSDASNEWQAHSHPDIEEYTYVLSGQVTAKVGDEVHELKQGDLLITPRGVPHKFSGGDANLLFFHSKHNVYGKTVQNKHPFMAYDHPARASEEDKKTLPPVGVYFEMDALEREMTQPDQSRVAQS